MDAPLVSKYASRVWGHCFRVPPRRRTSEMRQVGRTSMSRCALARPLAGLSPWNRAPNVLGDLPGDLDLDVGVVRLECAGQAGALLVGESVDPGAQGGADPVRGVAGAAAVS